MTVPTADDSDATNRVQTPAGGLSIPSLGWRLVLLVALGLGLALLLYYPVGAWRASVIDDDPAFVPSGVEIGQSRAAAVAAQLIRREIDVHGWTPNKPFFLPASILVAMPSFQTGIAAAVGRFATEMTRELGRPASGAGPADPDLARAAELLGSPPDVWMIDPKAPLARTLSTEKQYRNAARSLEAFNLRLKNGDATYDRGATALGDTLEAMAKDLTDAAATLDGPIAEGGGWFAHGVATLYYNGKGRAYASLLILKALGEDDRGLLVARGLDDSWQAMLASLRQASRPRPWLVMVGGGGSALVPDHLAVQGYHLLMAASRLNDIAEALR